MTGRSHFSHWGVLQLYVGGTLPFVCRGDAPICMSGRRSHLYARETLPIAWPNCLSGGHSPREPVRESHVRQLARRHRWGWSSHLYVGETLQFVCREFVRRGDARIWRRPCLYVGETFPFVCPGDTLNCMDQLLVGGTLSAKLCFPASFETHLARHCPKIMFPWAVGKTMLPCIV